VIGVSELRKGHPGAHDSRHERRLLRACTNDVFGKFDIAEGKEAIKNTYITIS
jgi:hypothetical protein